MTDTPSVTAPSVETTAPVEVAQTVSNAKPYDDELLDAYEAEAKEEAGAAEPKETKTTEQSEKQEDPTGERKGDKVDDGFEEVPVKKLINGKEVEFKVKDAIQAFVKQEEFNRNMDRRVGAVSAREQRFAADQAQLREKVGKVMEVAQKGDFVSGIRALAKLAKGDSDLDITQFERQYFDQLDKVREVYTKMTPEQRESYFAKRALAESKTEADQLRTEKLTASQQAQLQQRVVQVQKENNLSNDEFWGNYKFLEEKLVGPDKHFKSREDITAEDVVKYSLRVKHEAKVLQAGEKAGISDDRFLDEVSRISLSQPDLTVDDIVKIIEASGVAKMAPKSAVENLNRKAGKSNTRFNQASSTKKQDAMPEGYDREMLEELYRKQPKVIQRPVR